MSHRHFCDFAGHYWECDGTAVRLLAPEASVCICLDHGVPMDEGDHSNCSVELLSCPEHRAEQMTAMGYDPSYTIEPSSESEQSSMFIDATAIIPSAFVFGVDKTSIASKKNASTPTTTWQTALNFSG